MRQHTIPISLFCLTSRLLPSYRPSRTRGSRIKYFDTDDLRESIVHFGGGSKQLFFVGLVCKSWLELLYGQESERTLRREESKEPSTTTVKSQIVMPVPCANAALDGGWSGGNGACKKSSVLEDVQALQLCGSRGIEWGPEVFAAAAAAAGYHEVLEWLILAGCGKGEMGPKALQVAVPSGRAELEHAVRGMTLR